MERLSYKYLQDSNSKDYYLKDAPEKVIQFGEGNFLRAFVDNFFDLSNEMSGFNGKVVVVTPIHGPMQEKFEAQDSLYTLYLRGMEDGQKVEKRRLISVISRVLDATCQFNQVLECAKNTDIKFIVSNTTEAGIAYKDTDKFDDPENSSYPAKLTRFLLKRYEECGKENAPGFVLLPCELIEENGKNLKKCMLQYCDLWNLDAGFKTWVENNNHFCSTLVDRIVPGYPRDDVERYTNENGYEDQLLDAAEPFGFWAIEGDAKLNDVLPFMKAGLPILVTPDITFYKKRKVWVLNGGHTSMTTAALLSGLETVGECMADPDVSSFIKKAIYEEIIPPAPLDTNELIKFADSVMDRFKNPFIKHQLMSISLNTTSKWKARVLPSLHHYIDKNGSLPKALVFGFTCNLMFGISGKFEVKDDKEVLDFFAANKDKSDEDLALAYTTNKEFWGENLDEINGFTNAVIENIKNIKTLGAREALKKAING